MASEKVPQIPLNPNALFNSNTDAKITRLSKVLSTSSGVDATLTLVGYGLVLISSQLHRLETLELKALLSPKTPNAALKPGTASLIKLASLESSTKALAGMCSDFRTFTRLWGLLGVYSVVKKQYAEPPKDMVVRVISYAQTLSLGTYYVYENGYYLAGKGVLKGWTAVDIKRWAKTSLRMFLAYVLMEFVKLYRTRQLREERRVKAVDEDEKRVIEAEEKVWWKSALMNVAYTPLSMHWASENGLISDGAVGALMTYVGLVKFKAAWAQAV